MVYESAQGTVDMNNLTRLYAAALIEAGGETAEMSLEWMEMSGDRVKLLHYVLVFDYTPPGSETRNKKILTFETKDALLEEMQKVVDFIQSNNQ